MARFALDEAFPDTIFTTLEIGIREAELVPLRRIEKRLLHMEDWRLFLSLHHLGDWDGIVSTDSSILNLPRELSVIHQTGLTLVIIDRAGHDPIRAAGLLLVHLPTICRKTVRGKGQIWKLSAQSKNHEEPMEHLRRIAAHRSISESTLFHESKLSRAELQRNPLQELPFEP